VEIGNDDLVFATIITITEYERHDIEKRISKLRHEFNNLVIEDIHRHIGEKYCVEIFHTEGKNSEISNLIGRIRGIKGIIQLKYTIVSLS
jgi:CopG family nickel-responsive transcriptional regulator